MEFLLAVGVACLVVGPETRERREREKDDELCGWTEKKSREQKK